MRNELDMKEIRNFFQKLNNQDFNKEIANVFDGAYKELLQYLYTK